MWVAVSTSLPRGNHGWRFTARLQVLRFRCPRFCFGFRCCGFWFLFCLFWNLCFVSKSLGLVFVSRMFEILCFYVEIRCDGFCFPGFVLKSSVPPLLHRVLLNYPTGVIVLLNKCCTLPCSTGLVALLDRCCVARQVLLYCSAGVGVLLSRCIARCSCIAQQVYCSSGVGIARLVLAYYSATPLETHRTFASEAREAKFALVFRYSLW